MFLLSMVHDIFEVQRMWSSFIMFENVNKSLENIKSSVVRHCFHQRLPLQHYPFRKMYWGGRGISLKIEQANMDGSGRTTLVSSGLTWVNSLAMDYQSRLLYWCDGYHHRIERVDLQGNNRVVILDLSLDSTHTFGLALFGNAIFWSDWNSQSIHKYNMTTSVKEVVVHGMALPMELHVYDQSKLFTGRYYIFVN